ncbi:DNA polymerase I [Candidatus Saccharibacteria bacterium]|nr:DNA polymerase I [Candidatus Saccharibacteria bacterium]
MKRLVVIDGKSVFYRGYYAMGTLTTSDGTPTGGVYGFAAIAMELVRKLSPDKVVVAWDKAKTSVSKRVAIYPDYKAGRKKPPEDFFAQIPLLKKLVESLGWDFVECDDYEADDIIGTFGKKVDEAGDWEMYIISSDLDMLQVVDENVKMYRLLKGFSELEEIDVVAIEKKYGIRKEQFLDLKALKGDSSDNIPGVPGIGEKGAVKLLNEYGSLDGIYNNIDKITGSVQKKLIEGKESAYMSYKLAKIMTDAPVLLDEVPDLEIDVNRILASLDKLEFRSLKRKFLKWKNEGDFGEKQGSEADWSAEASCAKNEEKELEELPKDTIFSFDVTGLMHRDAEVAEKILDGAKFYDLGQGKFLLNPLERKDESQASLFSDDAKEMRAEYNRQKVEYEKCPKLYKVLTELDFPLTPVLFKIERRGMKIDRAYFEKLRVEYEAYVGRLATEVYLVAGREFNLNSPIQLSEVLFGELGLPTKGIKKTQRGYSTGAKELEKLKDLHPVIPKLMEYREASKLFSTYILPLPQLADENGRVHTTLTQNVTATGRLSSVSPNLQNIPTRTEAGRKIREGFVADEEKVLVSADYAQFELRLAAAMAGDEKLIEDFNSGVDIHTKTAAEVFGVPMEEVTKDQRRLAKVVNFGIIYGMSAKGLADATGMSIAEAKEFERQYFELRKPIAQKLKSYLEQARTKGYVETLFGRRRPTPDVKSSNFLVRAGAERAAQNMPIQGTEADLMKLAMIRLDKVLPDGAEMIMQVHDSIMVECEPSLVMKVKKLMKEVMENVCPELGVKLAVDTKEGKKWSEV